MALVAPAPPPPRLVVNTLDVGRAFRLESFADYLGLEAGNSRHTVESYLRDLRRFAEHAVAAGTKDPAAVTTVQVREFIYQLKDLGLAPSSIRRQISALRTY